MSEFEDKLAQLTTRLKHLENYETAFKREIADIRREINLLNSKKQLNKTEIDQTSFAKPPAEKPLPKKEYIRKDVLPNADTIEKNHQTRKSDRVPYAGKPPETIATLSDPNLEKFIGENLISKIGIVVLIIGVGIGAKYAIDNDLISPLVRILFGYTVGLVLIGLAVKLKPKYHDYSAVLMSGGMAIMYFITYFAYNFYALISQTSAFALMVIFTIFTVLASIIYNRQVIAHIGLVGAYAVPFLLSENSGRYAVLFTYIAILNIGILAVSVKKYWTPLFFTSFIFTWLIYAAWHFEKYNYAEHFALNLTFLTIFFATFYFTFIAYKLIQEEEFRVENILFVLLNSFIFFGFGYASLDNEFWNKYLGLYTLFNALIHFAVCVVINQLKLKDKTAFYFCAALVLTFITIAVPVQFEGHWVTILWIAEAVFLFVIGRMKKIAIFEYFSYPIMIFSGVSLLNEWQKATFEYPSEITNALYPFINSNFLTTLAVAIGLGIIYVVDRDKKYKTALEESLYTFVKYAIPTALLIVLYNLFRIEIGNYFQYVELKTAIRPTEDLTGYSDLIKDNSVQLFSFIWQLNYTMFFLTALSFLNIKKLKRSALGFINLTLNSATLAIFLVVALIIFSHLGDLYLNPTESHYFKADIYNILIRYISYIFVATLIFACYRYIKQEFITKVISAKYLLIAFDLGLYFFLLVILSSELINWSDIFGIKEIYRLGLTILFGLYAVFLIVLGITQKKQHLRIFAIALFAVTLIKLFFYDIAELNTISKTIVTISVGVLLLIASFLYTKYKSIIFEDEII